MRSFSFLLFGLSIASSALAESDAARAELAIQLALDYTKQALAAPPELRDDLWAKAESACTAFVEGVPEHPRRVLVEVQLALVSSARGEQARLSRDNAQAIDHLRGAARRFNDVAESVSRELIDLRLRRQGERPAEGLSVGELESLEANVSFQLARSQHQLALCYPTLSPDRDDGLLQAVKLLTPLSQRTPPDDLTWNARVELAACLGALGQADSAEKLVAGWLRENPPNEVGQRLAALPATAALGSNSHEAGTRHDVFAAAMAAAAGDRAAGRLSKAIERYRNLALRQPNHARANAAHLLAVLCTADLLRESPPAERATHAESYERMLREHLAQWPARDSADKIRQWLGQLLARRRDWPAAIEVLRQVEPASATASESVQLLARCYERQLRQLDTAEQAHERGQLLAAAASHLQPIITGTDNRWPDPWSKLQRRTAVALARLHLRFASQASPYAEQLLTAALRGRPADGADSDEMQSWEAAAKVLLVEALARNGKAIEARALVDRLDYPSIDALLESLEAIDGLLTGGSSTAIDQRALGELSLSILRLVDARRSQFDADTNARLDAWRAAALAAAGDRAAALTHYAALAEKRPNDGELQERYAALLATSDAAPELRQALRRWQQVESRSRRGGPRWRRARAARIELLTRLGERTEAEKLIRLTRLLYPDWDQTAQPQN